MRAVTWQGNEKMEVKTVPDPTIEEPTDRLFASQQQLFAVLTCIYTITGNRSWKKTMW